MTAVVNSTDRPGAHISGKITTGTSPTSGNLIEFYLCRSDGTYRVDQAGALDAAITITNADLVYTIQVTSTSDFTYQYSFYVGGFDQPLGEELIIAVRNATGVALNATAGNHVLSYEFELPDVQAAA